MKTNDSVPALAPCLLVSVLFSVSCANSVTLMVPRNQDRLQVGNSAGPEFRWSTASPVDTERRYEYQLSVKRGSTVVFTKDRIEANQFVIPAEVGWLSGDSEYEWSVEGIARDETGEIVESLICEGPRRFYLESRDEVAIDIKLPEGDGIENSRVLIGDEEFTSNSSFEMENGESRRIVISFDKQGESVLVGGRISVVGYNENTEFGKIIIENFDADELVAISNGEVGNYTYQLGGDEIVKMTLGSRTRN